MEPCSQKPATGPCTEPDEFSPHPPSHLPEIHFNIMLPSCLGIRNGILPSVCLLKTLYVCLMPATRSVNFILLGLIILEYLERRTSYEAPHYAVLSILLLLNTS
jgi:hypothetical protein